MTKRVWNIKFLFGFNEQENDDRKCGICGRKLNEYCPDCIVPLGPNQALLKNAWITLLMAQKRPDCIWNRVDVHIVAKVFEWLLRWQEPLVSSICNLNELVCGHTAHAHCVWRRIETLSAGHLVMDYWGGCPIDNERFYTKAIIPQRRRMISGVYVSYPKGNMTIQESHLIVEWLVPQYGNAFKMSCITRVFSQYRPESVKKVVEHLVKTNVMKTWNNNFFGLRNAQEGLENQGVVWLQ